MADRRRPAYRTRGAALAVIACIGLGGLSACGGDAADTAREVASELPSRGEVSAKACDEYRQLAAQVEDLDPNVQKPQQLVKLGSDLQAMEQKAQALQDDGQLGDLATQLANDVSQAVEKVGDAVTSAKGNAQAAVQKAVQDVQAAWDRFQQRAEARCGS